MDYKKIINKLNEKNTTVLELLSCPYCKSIDITTDERIENTYYYKKEHNYIYLEEYKGQKPIGISALYTCHHCGADFLFTGELTNTKIETTE